MDTCLKLADQRLEFKCTDVKMLAFHETNLGLIPALYRVPQPARSDP